MSEFDEAMAKHHGDLEIAKRGLEVALSWAKLDHQFNCPSDARCLALPDSDFKASSCGWRSRLRFLEGVLRTLEHE